MSSDKVEEKVVAEDIGADDDDPKNFVMVEKGAGSLLCVKRKIEHVMSIKDRQFIELEPEDNVLILYDFNNVKTAERVLIFLIEDRRYMYMTKEFDDDFKVLFKGTYKQKTNSEATPDETVEDLFDVRD